MKSDRLSLITKTKHNREVKKPGQFWPVLYTIVMDSLKIED